MTYNFDPESWYEREWAVLATRLKADALSREAFEAACEELTRRYHEMLARLDGTYRIG